MLSSLLLKMQEVDMIIGCPTEVKNNAYRVGWTPSMALDLGSDGHKVLIQKGAGIGSGFSDENYRSIGAIIKEDGTRVIENSEMIIKVKEQQKEERQKLTKGQILMSPLIAENGHMITDRDEVINIFNNY